MKLDKKGFMMAEVVVVSAIVLIFLASLFVSYNELYSKYKTRVKYYDSATLYQLGYYRDTLVENKTLGTALENAKTNKLVSVFNSESESESLFQLSDRDETKDRAYLIYNNKENIKGNELDGISSVNVTFKDYLNYLASSVRLDSEYVMVMEKCSTDDDCKYAYLEVYEGAIATTPNYTKTIKTCTMIEVGNCFRVAYWNGSNYFCTEGEYDRAQSCIVKGMTRDWCSTNGWIWISGSESNTYGWNTTNQEAVSCTVGDSFNCSAETFNQSYVSECVPLS